MFDYLEKYNKLSKEVRDKMSAPAVMAVVSELEKKYGLNLAGVVMKVMVGAIKLETLDIFLMENEKFDESKAKMLAAELRRKVFSAAADYLGIKIELDIPQKSEMPFKKEAVAVMPKPLSGAGKEDLSFSREDKKEIKDLAGKISGSASVARTGEDASEKIDKIFNKAGINFGSEMLAGRFKNILKIYLRGVRDKIETKQTLMKPIESGGLGFDEDSARNILSIAGGGAAMFADKPIIFTQPRKIFVLEDIAGQKEEAAVPRPSDANLNKLKMSGVRDVGYDFSGFKNKKENGMEKLDTAHELAPPPPKIRAESSLSMEPRRETMEEAKKEDKKPEMPFVEKVIEPPVPNKNFGFFWPRKEKKAEPILKSEKKQESVSGSAPSVLSGGKGKIKMEDIKYKPKVMGPIDELRYMDLINFRRLGLDSAQSAEAVKNKINLFGEYKERQEAIAAWRLCPLNKLYLEMGQESISNNKPIDVIIEERKNAGKDYLKPPELEVIIRLNKELRF